MKQFLKVEPILSLIVAFVPIVIAGILFFFVLPDTIPHHIDITGTVTRTGGKWIIFLLPAILFVLYLGLHFFVAFILSKKSFSQKTVAIVRMAVAVTTVILNIFYLVVLTQASTTL